MTEYIAVPKDMLESVLKLMLWNPGLSDEAIAELYATRKAIVAKLAEPEPAIDNPVAWVEVEDSTEGPYEFHGIEYLPRGKHNLYTHPPKREPLSLDECIAAYLSEPSKTCESDEFLRGIRYAEKMHGIGS